MITQLFQTFADACNKPTFFGLKPWYQYLDLKWDAVAKQCRITNFDARAGTQKIIDADSPFLLIGLAIVDDLLRIAALVAVGYVIYGGFIYITSQGSPEMTKKGQQTVINALIGLATAIVASAVVGFFGNRIAG